MAEFVSQILPSYFQDHDIIHETTCPYTPQQNGVAERKNRHILEITRACLIDAHMSSTSWRDVIFVLKFKTLLEKLSAYVSIPSNLTLAPRILGCVAFVHLHKHQWTKLDSCALRCVFVGYLPHKKGYKCYYPPTIQFYLTMDVTFSETEMYFSSHPSTSTLQGETYSEEMNWMVVLPDVVMTSKNPSNMGIGSAQELFAGIGSRPQCDTTTSSLAPQSPTRSPSTPIVPTNDSTVADVTELCIDSEVNTNNLINDHVSVCDENRYQLPPRSSRGKPPKRYSLDHSKTSKYSIAHYVSTKQLPYSIKAFAN
ncbi:hypothetical protein CR513_37666, partial [Mucuna pruriens]